jgi:hypothetical protein
MHGRKETAYSILIGKPEKKSPPRRTRRRCNDNNEMDFREIGYGVID